MNLYDETKFIMKKYNVTANKSYGQNFLVDENIVSGIVEKAGVCQYDLVLEIGPGLGTLTEQLLKNAGKVICVELDPKMLSILEDRFKLYENFELINNDILKVDIKELIEKNSKFKNVKVVANLPYYITTPIIMKLLEERLNLESITVMVQKEVAERLAENPGGKQTGAITYTINYFTEPEIVLDVNKDCFVPSPKVDSAVLKLTLLNEPRIEVKSEDMFFKVIKAAFLQKRKTLVNSLSNSGLVDKESVEKILESMNLDLRVRAEQLSIEEFGKIADFLI